MRFKTQTDNTKKTTELKKLSSKKNSTYRDFSIVIRYLWTSRRKKEKIPYLRFATECIHTLLLDRYSKTWLHDEVNIHKEEKVTKNIYLDSVQRLYEKGYAERVDALRQVSVVVKDEKN